MLASIWYAMPKERMKLEQLREGDWWGILCMAIGLGSLIAMLEEGQRKDWFGSPFIVNCAILAAIFVPLFVLIEVVREKRPKGAKPYRFPAECPCPLHTPVVRDETATGEAGAVSRCSGEFACPYQRIEHLKHFVSRRAFDIDGLGEKQIEFFYEQGWVREPADIFTLEKRNKEIRLEQQEGYGETSIGNLFRAISQFAGNLEDRLINIAHNVIREPGGENCCAAQHQDERETGALGGLDGGDAV